jgi:MFS family permease
MEHMRAFLKGIHDPRLRRSLIYSLFDGAMWALMFGFAENYMARFAVFFGASVVELSILQGFSQLANGGGQLLGGYLVQHSGISRQRLSCVTVAIHASSWLLAFLGAWISGNPLVGILIYCAGSFFTNIGSPGWSSWMNDLVPEKRRGAFWSWRNSILGLVQFAAIIAAMLFLHFAKRSKLELPAYGILFSLAFVCRMGSVFFLSRQHHPRFEPDKSGDSLSLLKFLRELPKSDFGRFTVFIALTNFAMMMASPIIQAYLLVTRKLDYLPYTMITMASTVGAFLFMTYWGGLSDRFGNRRILIVTAVVLPALALAWVFVRPVWALVLLQLVTGFVTSGFSLATTNYVFDATPVKTLPKTMAYFNTLTMSFGFAGSLVSGLIAKLAISQGWQIGWFGPYLMVFALAALLRALIVIFFARPIKEVRAIEPSPGLPYFYVYKPFQDFTGALFRARDRMRSAGKKRK